MSCTFVLVHGAWHGGWCWQTVARLLRCKGHKVTTPTQTGLGERSHLMSKHIDLDLMAEDIVNHIVWEDLSGITLVGHSFAGGVISGVADRIPDRLEKLIYFDAVWLENDQSVFGLLPDDIVAEREKLSLDFDGGTSIPPPPPEAFGVFEAAAGEALKERLTPHPLSAFKSKLQIRNAPTNGIPAHYIVCTEPVYAPLAPARQAARSSGIPFHDLAGPHDAMVTHPEETAELLERL